MSEVSDFVKTLAPLPWNASLDDGSRWGLTVIAGDGDNVSEREMDRDEARYMTAIHAISPEALIYVEEAAAKGGKTAQEIFARFKRMAIYDPSPEERVRMRTKGHRA